MKAPASGMKVIGDRPIETLYAEAWESFAKARDKSGERKPTGPGWMSYGEFAKFIKCKPQCAPQIALRLRRKGLAETFTGYTVLNGQGQKKGYIRPLLKAGRQS